MMHARIQVIIYEKVKFRGIGIQYEMELSTYSNLSARHY